MKIKQDDINKVQAIMHYYGLDNFQLLLAYAAKQASEETEDINKNISDKWEEFSQLNYTLEN